MQCMLKLSLFTLYSATNITNTWILFYREKSLFFKSLLIETEFKIFLENHINTNSHYLIKTMMKRGGGE